MSCARDVEVLPARSRHQAQCCQWVEAPGIRRPALVPVDETTASSTVGAHLTVLACSRWLRCGLAGGWLVAQGRFGPGLGGAPLAVGVPGVQRPPPAAEQVVGLMGPLVPAHCLPVRGLRRGVTAGEAAQDLLICRLGILVALLAGERTGPPEQQPGGELGRRPVSLPGVVLEPIRAQDAQVRCPDLPEPLDQGGAGLVGGVDLNRDKVLGDGGGDRRLAVADIGQRCAAASSGGEEVHQDQRAGCLGLLVGGVQVSGPPADRFHACRLAGSRLQSGHC
jgi:hypothetical protein